MRFLSDPSNQRLLIVAFQSIFILGFAIEMYRSANAVQNIRLIQIFWTAALHTSIFFMLRIFASWLDNAYFEFETGYFGALVLTGGFASIHYRAWHLRRILENPKNEETRIGLRKDIDVIMDRIHTARDLAKKLLT